MLFLIKIGFVFKNPLNYVFNGQKNGLTYNSATISDLVNKDTDGDSIPDWEERLYGTDPTKKETTPGTPDAVAIAKLSAQNENISGGQASSINGGNEKLTKTDQFSRELFSTVAAASQNGQTLDQASIDKISSSLADTIKNSNPRKVYSMSDIKITNNDSVKSIKNYSDILYPLYPKETKYTVLDVLQKFVADENNVDVGALSLLDPIIAQMNKTINGMARMTVPKKLSALHVNVLNSFERVVENLNDIKLYDTDTIVALAGMTRYNQNGTTLISDATKLADAIRQGLNP